MRGGKWLKCETPLRTSSVVEERVETNEMNDLDTIPSLI